MIFGQKRYGVFIDNSDDLRYNGYKDKLEFM